MLDPSVHFRQSKICCCCGSVAFFSLSLSLSRLAILCNVQDFYRENQKKNVVRSQHITQMCSSLEDDFAEKKIGLVFDSSGYLLCILVFHLLFAIFILL